MHTQMHPVFVTCQHTSSFAFVHAYIGSWCSGAMAAAVVAVVVLLVAATARGRGEGTHAHAGM